MHDVCSTVKLEAKNGANLGLWVRITQLMSAYARKFTFIDCNYIIQLLFF